MQGRFEPGETEFDAVVDILLELLVECNINYSRENADSDFYRAEMFARLLYEQDNWSEAELRAAFKLHILQKPYPPTINEILTLLQAGKAARQVEPARQEQDDEPKRYPTREELQGYYNNWLVKRGKVIEFASHQKKEV